MKIKTIPTIAPPSLDPEPKKDFAAIEKESYIDVNKQERPQPVALSMGEVSRGSNFFPVPIGSYGDYSCIVGPSKSKKTFLKSAFAAAYIGGQSNYYFETIKGHDAAGKYVIDIDTEQSRYHSQLVAKRVPKMVGSYTPYYRPYATRTHDPADRVSLIDWLVYESPYKGKIGLFLIDGLVDLLYNFNDLDQSQELQKKLLRWSEDGNCHIMGVLHRNFGSDKPVGHIGSAVLKKAETVIFLDKDEHDRNVTHVKCEYSRNIPFDDFSFEVGSDWLPHQYHDVKEVRMNEIPFNN